MKKILYGIVIFALGSATLYAAPRPPNVVVDGLGNPGDVLVSEGTAWDKKHTVGTWEDRANFKGDKGDKGETGNGNNGRDGVQDLSSVENGLYESRETKIGVEGVLRIYDAKKYTLELYDTYDAKHGKNFFFGGRITYKIGKSYEEREMVKLKKEIDFLHSVVYSRAINSPIFTAPYLPLQSTVLPADVK